MKSNTMFVSVHVQIAAVSGVRKVDKETLEVAASPAKMGQRDEIVNVDKTDCGRKKYISGIHRLAIGETTIHHLLDTSYYFE